MPELVCYACDGCGRALETVGELAEVVGFRFAGSPTPRIEADHHWMDDGGELEAASLALPRPTDWSH